MLKRRVDSTRLKDAMCSFIIEFSSGYLDSGSSIHVQSQFLRTFRSRIIQGFGLSLKADPDLRLNQHLLRTLPYHFCYCSTLHSQLFKPNGYYSALLYLAKLTHLHLRGGWLNCNSNPTLRRRLPWLDAHMWHIHMTQSYATIPWSTSKNHHQNTKIQSAKSYTWCLRESKQSTICTNKLTLPTAVCWLSRMWEHPNHFLPHTILNCIIDAIVRGFVLDLSYFLRLLELIKLS